MAGLATPHAPAVSFGFAGKRLLQRDVAGFIAPLWQNQEERIKALATAQGESRLHVGAWHDNLKNGVIDSRDCGVMQINIDGEDVGTEEEFKLRTTSLAPEIYNAVVKYNFERSRRLYDNPWPVHEKRLWQPWVAYTTGWAMFKEWFVWKHVDKQPVGPWIATGRFLQGSIRGWANWYIHEELKSQADALAWAKSKQKLYKIQGELDIKKDWVAWVDWPDMPQDPPSDGVGPRPKPNNGK